MMNKSPDFFLEAAGEFEPLSEPRVCRVICRLRDLQRDDYMLIEIDPPLIGRQFGLGDKDLSLLILSTRHKGFTLYPITEWPSHVYVTRILDESILETQSFNPNQVELIAWARIYPTIEDANRHVKQHEIAKRSVRSSQKFQVKNIRFIGEQDGIPERELKSKLSALFETDERIWKAYLARVDFGKGTEIALCLRTVMGPDDILAEKILKIFALLFVKRDFLDIIFINSEQESDLTQVCKPFYTQTVARRV